VPVDQHAQAAIEPAQPGDRQEHLDHRPDHDRDGIYVQLRVHRLRSRDAEHEPGDDREVPEDGAERRNGEALVAVEDPDDDPETPSSATIGKSTRDSPTASSLSPPGSPNRPMIHGAATMKIAVSPVRKRRTSQKRLDATRHAR
jgi:hypothetical protein